MGGSDLFLLQLIEFSNKLEDIIKQTGAHRNMGYKRCSQVHVHTTMHNFINFIENQTNVQGDTAN
jgi:hypothetical protein